MTQQTRTRTTLLVLMGLTALRIPLAMALRTLLPDASVAPTVNYIAALLQSLLMFALPGWLLLPRWENAPEAQGFRLNELLLPLLAAALARLAATPLNALWAGLIGAQGAAMPRVGTPLEIALMVLAVAVIPAIAEEVFFRGALLTNLLQAGSRGQAVALTTMMFALMHGSLAGLPGHLIVSLLLTLLMVRSGSLAAPVVAHMAFNLLALVQLQLPAYAPWLAGGVLVLLTAWLLVTMPQGRPRRLPVAERLLCAAILLAMAVQYVM